MNTLFERNITNYKDEWLTPPSIIKALGEFDLDPCAPINRLWDTANNHFTIADDGLQKQWFGRVWCNPPYSDNINWLKKSVHHGNTTVLIFARTETKWFFKYIWEAADSILFLKNRVSFLTDKGVKKWNAGAPSVLVAYGKNNVDAIEDSKLPGKHIYLNYTPMIIVGISPTWFSVVSIAIKHFGDDELKPVYDLVEIMAPDKIIKNQHWKAKVRQQVQEWRKKKP